MKRDVKMLISLKKVVGTGEASAVLLQDRLQGEALFPIPDYYALITHLCQQVGGFRDACDAACKTACRFEETCPLNSDSCDLGSSFLSKIRDSNPSYSVQQRNPFCPEDIAMFNALRIDPTPGCKVGHDTLEAVSVLQETVADFPLRFTDRHVCTLTGPFSKPCYVLRDDVFRNFQVNPGAAV